MERKLAELKADEVAELKRYETGHYYLFTPDLVSLFVTRLSDHAFLISIFLLFSCFISNFFEKLSRVTFSIIAASNQQY